MPVTYYFVKFADDTYLISGAATCHTISDEIEGVHRWATKNNLHVHVKLNSRKSIEMLIVSGGRWRLPHPLPLGNGIVRVDHMKILGVTIRNGLKMTTHACRRNPGRMHLLALPTSHFESSWPLR